MAERGGDKSRTPKETKEKEKQEKTKEERQRQKKKIEEGIGFLARNTADTT